MSASPAKSSANSRGVKAAAAVFAELAWVGDSASQRLLTARRLCCEDFVLDESPCPPRSGLAAAKELARLPPPPPPPPTVVVTVKLDGLMLLAAVADVLVTSFFRPHTGERLSSTSVPMPLACAVRALDGRTPTAPPPPPPPAAPLLSDPGATGLVGISDAEADTSEARRSRRFAAADRESPSLKPLDRRGLASPCGCKGNPRPGGLIPLCSCCSAMFVASAALEAELFCRPLLSWLLPCDPLPLSSRTGGALCAARGDERRPPLLLPAPLILVLPAARNPMFALFKPSATSRAAAELSI